MGKSFLIALTLVTAAQAAVPSSAQAGAISECLLRWLRVKSTVQRGPTEISAGARALTEYGLSGATANQLATQYVGLRNGTFDTNAPGPIARFFKNFWSPSNGILGAEVADGPRGGTANELIVYLRPERLDAAKSLLPETFDGLPVQLRAIDPAWSFAKTAPKVSPRPQQPVVVVTGAAGELGNVMVKDLLAQGYRVVATARKGSAETLRSKFPEDPNLMIVAMDVTNAAEQRAMLEQVTKAWGGVDILVNNAGVVVQGTGANTARSDLQMSIDTNFVGAADLANNVLPMMEFKGWGRIINISSSSATVPVPTMGAYGASKAALNAYMNSLAVEVKPWNVRVSTVELGFLKGNAHANIALTGMARLGMKDPTSQYYSLYQRMLRVMSLGRDATWADSQYVSTRLMDLLAQKNPPIQRTLTPDAMLFSFLRRALPQHTYVTLLNEMLRLGAKVREWFPDGHAPGATPPTGGQPSAK